MATKKADAILTFGYEATDRKGQKIKGEVTGTNIALAKAQLRKQGFNVQKISKKSSFSFQDFKQPIINTLGVGTVTALFATFIAFCISVVATRSRTGKSISRLVMTIHAIPGIVTAIAFVFVGTRVVPGIYLEWPLVIIALCVSFGYLAITPIKNSLDRKNKTLLDVSSSLGRGNYFTLTKVTIPLSSNGLKAAAILVFVAAIKELPITLLLRPNEQNTLATYLWSNLGVSKFAVVAPSMLLLIFISAVPLMFLIKGKYD